MLLAALGDGAYPTLEAGIRRAVRVKKAFLPNSDDVTYYARKYEKYKLLYQRMHNFQ